MRLRRQTLTERYPFDPHRLDAIFEVLGFDESEVVLARVSASDDLSDAAVGFSKASERRHGIAKLPTPDR